MMTVANLIVHCQSSTYHCVCVCVCVCGGGVWVCEEEVGVISLGELAHVQRENDFTKKTE